MVENMPCRVFLWCFLKVQERKEQAEGQEAHQPTELTSERVLPRIGRCIASQLRHWTALSSPGNLSTLFPAKSQSLDANHEAARLGDGSVLAHRHRRWFSMP